MTKQTNKNQEEKNTEKKPEPVKIENWNQDNETVEGGVEFREKYFKRFGVFVRADLHELILVNVGTGEETILKQPIKTIVLYAHPSIKLTQGVIDGKDRKEWTDEDKMPIARTLMSPFGKKQASLGSFKNAKLIEWITDIEKYKQLINRCWIFARIANWKNGKENIILSFGSSAWHSLESARNVLKIHNRHISTNFLELSLEKAVNDDGQPYFKPTFKIISGGNTCTEKEFPGKFGNEINKLKKEHLDEVAATENQILISQNLNKYPQEVIRYDNEGQAQIAGPENEGLPEDDMPF